MSLRTLQLAFGAALFGPLAVVVACGGEKEGACEAPSADDLVVESFGSQAIADTGGYIDVQVTVPDGATSTLAFCGGYGDSALGAVWTLTDPGGNVVYDGNDPEASPFRSDFTDDWSSALVPMTPELPLTPGTWTVQWFVGAGHDGDAECGAVHRTSPPASDAAVTVDLVFVGLDGLDATTAPDDASFQAVLVQLEAEWASAGLTPCFQYRDFDGDVAKFAVVDVSDDDYAEFNDLLRTASPDGDRTLTFFLVQEIANSSAGGATILGLAGGPPGAAALHGNSKAGVIVSAIDYDAAPEDVGKIMAHEGGHFLGLYHTSEKSGGQHDALGDTPQCTAADDADGNGTVSVSECGGKGGENVMFWTLTQGTASFSADQGWVVQRNPAVE